MQDLIQFEATLQRQISDSWARYMFGQLLTDERLVGIRGLRGVGKTTMLLQHHKYGKHGKKALYITADHPYFYTSSLFETARQWDLGPINR